VMRPNQSNTEATIVITKKMGIALEKNWLMVPWVSRQMADQRGIAKNVRRSIVSVLWGDRAAKGAIRQV